LSGLAHQRSHERTVEVQRSSHQIIVGNIPYDEACSPTLAELRFSLRSTSFRTSATRCRMSPLSITRPSQPVCAGPSGPSRVAMRISAYFGKRLCGMLSWIGMCKHAHLYRSASAAGWLTRSVCRPRPASHASHGHRRSPTTLTILIVETTSEHCVPLVVTCQA